MNFKQSNQNQTSNLAPSQKIHTSNCFTAYLGQIHQKKTHRASYIRPSLSFTNPHILVNCDFLLYFTTIRSFSFKGLKHFHPSFRQVDENLSRDTRLSPHGDPHRAPSHGDYACTSHSPPGETDDGKSRGEICPRNGGEFFFCRFFFVLRFCTRQVFFFRKMYLYNL